MILIDINKTKNVLFKSENLRELRHKLEELSFDYLNSLQVSEQKYYKKSKSGKWGNAPFGFFMVYSGNKIQIYNKQLQKGFVYNGYTVFKFITFELIEPVKKPFFNTAGFDMGEVKKKLMAFHDIHNEILEKKKAEEIIENLKI